MFFNFENDIWRTSREASFFLKAQVFLKKINDDLSVQQIVIFEMNQIETLDSKKINVNQLQYEEAMDNEKEKSWTPKKHETFHFE